MTNDESTKKAEPMASKNASSSTGRTAWDALVDVGAMLGSFTPWIVIAAGLFYGMFHFIGLQNEIDNRVADEKRKAQEEVNQAHTDLQHTFTEIRTMHKDQLANLESMLAFNTKLRSEGDQLKRDAEKANKDVQDARIKADLATAEAKSATAEAKSATAEANKAQEKRSQFVRKVEETKKELNAQLRELNEAQLQLTALGRRTEYVMRLRDRLFEIAERLVLSTDPSVVALGRDIQNEASSEAKRLLTEYANKPGKDTGDSLDDLVGTTEEALEAALSGGVGFTFWQKYARSDQTLTGYVGVVRQTDGLRDERVVYLVLTNKKVERVHVFETVLSVATPNPNDWNDEGDAYNLYGRRSGELAIDRFEKNKLERTWNLSQTMLEYPEGKPPSQIYGSEDPLFFMNFARLKTEEEIYPRAQKDRGNFGSVLAMLQNAEDFDADRIAELFARDMPNGLRNTFVRLLTESVKRQTMSVKIAPGSALTDKVYGRIAAAALKPGFKITAVGSRQGSTITSGKAETYFIRCEYHNVSSEADSGIPSEVTLTFARQGSDGGWTLLNFESSAPVEE